MSSFAGWICNMTSVAHHLSSCSSGGFSRSGVEFQNVEFHGVCTPTTELCRRKVATRFLLRSWKWPFDILLMLGCPTSRAYIPHRLQSVSSSLYRSRSANIHAGKERMCLPHPLGSDSVTARPLDQPYWSLNALLPPCNRLGKLKLTSTPCLRA